MLADVPTELPRRVPKNRKSKDSPHSETAYRERFCIVHLLMALIRLCPTRFPADLKRAESPDFILSCSDGTILAIEHTDVGEEVQYAHWARTAGEVAREALSPDDGGRLSTRGRGWRGSSAIGIREGALRHYESAIQAACERKLEQKYWANAPMGAERWLLSADESAASFAADDQDAAAIMRRALHQGAGCVPRYDAFVLIRPKLNACPVTLIEGPCTPA